MSERKIVHTSCTDQTVVALCDDGTAWTLNLYRDVQAWRELPPIPQKEPEPEYLVVINDRIFYISGSEVSYNTLCGLVDFLPHERPMITFTEPACCGGQIELKGTHLTLRPNLTITVSNRN